MIEKTAFSIIISIVSLFLIIYNVNITNVQKTPIQQNWMTRCFLFQIGTFFTFIVPDKDQLFFFGLIVLMSALYASLYLTKFNLKMTKRTLKVNIFIKNLLIVIVSIILLTFLCPYIMKGLLMYSYRIRNVLIVFICLYLMSFNVISLIYNFYYVKTYVHFLYISFLMLIILLCTLFKYSNQITFYLVNFSLLVMDFFIFIVICIKKGRFFNE